MTYADFLVELESARLTVREFAALMQMNPNSVSNYARSGEVPTHLAVTAALISELHKHGVNHQAVFGRLHLAGKRPRGRAGPGRFGGDRQGRLGL